MRQNEITEAIGKAVTLTRRDDLYMCEEARFFIGQECMLVKHCKNGWLQVERLGKFYSAPMSNVELLPPNKESYM